MPIRESSLSSVRKVCRILGVLADTDRARLTDVAIRAAPSIAAWCDRLLAREAELVAAMQREGERIADPRIPVPEMEMMTGKGASS